jgi:hypothetical protein
MKSLFAIALIAFCLPTGDCLAGDDPTSDSPPDGEIQKQSLFAAGPQVQVAALRKENQELKATIAQLLKRLETLERRLSKVERGNIQLVSDVEHPDSNGDRKPTVIQIPDAIERGMQIDAAEQSSRCGGAFILGIEGKTLWEVKPESRKDLFGPRPAQGK